MSNLKLTREECLFALESLKPANIYEFIAKGYLPFTEANSILTQLINEHFSFIESYQHLLRNYTNLSKINSEIKEENNRLSQQLVECQRVAKQKQEIIDSYLKKVEIDDIKVDSIEQLPIQLIHLQEQQIVEATNTYIASLGCDIRFNRNQMIKMLKMYQNPPLKFEELKENMWVWDNKTKSYIFIFKPLNWEPTKGIRYANMIIYHSAEGYYMDFEENRFYRREVK